jgi:hypothetical protein
MSLLYGPDGRPISSKEPAKPKLVDANAQPIKRQIREEDIEGFDRSKAQFLYARTADGKPATHGNDYKFFAHELDPGKMKEVDPNVVFVGRTTPKPVKLTHTPQRIPPPRNRKERRIAALRRRRGD